MPNYNDTGKSNQANGTMNEDSGHAGGTIEFDGAHETYEGRSSQAYRPTDYYYKALTLEEEVKSLQKHISLLQEQCWKAKSQNSLMKIHHSKKTTNAIEKLKKQLKDGEFDAVAREIRLLKASQQERETEEFQLMEQTRKWKERHDSEKRKRMVAVAENDFLRQKLADKHVANFKTSKAAGGKEVKQSNFQPIRRMVNLFARNKKEQTSTTQAPSASTEDNMSVEKSLPAASGDSPASAQDHSANESTPLISKAPPVTSSNDTTLVAHTRRNSPLFHNPARNGNFPVDNNGALIRTCGRTSVLDAEAARRNFEDAYAADLEQEDVVMDPFITPESDRSRRSVRMSLQEALREDSLHREVVARMNEG